MVEGAGESPVTVDDDGSAVEAVAGDKRSAKVLSSVLVAFSVVDMLDGSWNELCARR